MGILIALALFFIGIVYNIFFGAPMQFYYGLRGLAVTELGFALLALGTGIISLHTVRRGVSGPPIAAKHARGQSVADVFAFRLPKPRELMGGLLLAAGGFLIMNMMSTISARLFPSLYIETAEGIGSFMTGTTATLIIGMAFIPAVCEELLFRGAVQHALSRSLRPPATILLTGILFGLFHLDLLRSPITMVAGVLFSYAAFRSRSIIVPIIMHFAHNAAGVLASGTDTGMQMSAAEQVQSLTVAGEPLATQLAYVAGVAVLGISAVAILLCGFSMFERDLKRVWNAHRALSIAFLVFCVIIIAASAVTGFFPVNI